MVWSGRFTSSPMRSTSSPPGMLTEPGMHPRRYSSGVRESTITMSSPLAIRWASSGQDTCGVFHSCSARSPNTLLGTFSPWTVGRPAARQAASPPSSARTLE